MNDVTLKSKLTCWTLIFALLSAFITPSIATAATPVKGDLDHLDTPPVKSNYQLVERANQLKFVTFYSTKLKPYAYDIGSTLLSDAYNAYRNTRYEKEIATYPLITLADIKRSHLKFDQVVGILDTYAPNYSKTFKYNLIEFINGGLVKGNRVQNCYEWKADGTKKICFVGSDHVANKKFAAQPTARATALAAPTYTNSELVAQQNWINGIADADLNVIKQWHHAHFNMITAFVATTQPQKSLNLAARQLKMEAADDKKRLGAGTKKPTVILNSTTKRATFNLGNSTPKIEQPDLECANASVWSRFTHGCATTTASLQAHGNEAASVLVVENKTYPYENDNWTVTTKEYGIDENLAKAMKAGVDEQIKLLGGNITVNVTDQNGTALASYPSISPSATTLPSHNPSQFPTCEKSSIPSSDPLAVNPSPIPTTLPTINELVYDTAKLLHRYSGAGTKVITLAIDLVTIGQMGSVAVSRARLSPQVPSFGYDIDLGSFKRALETAVTENLIYTHTDADSLMGRAIIKAAAMIFTFATTSMVLQITHIGTNANAFAALMNKYPGQVPTAIQVRGIVNPLVGTGLSIVNYGFGANTIYNFGAIGESAQRDISNEHGKIFAALQNVLSIGRDFANSDISGCTYTFLNMALTRYSSGRDLLSAPTAVEIWKGIGATSRLFGALVTYAERNNRDIFKIVMGTIMKNPPKGPAAITVNTYTAALATIAATAVGALHLYDL